MFGFYLSYVFVIWKMDIIESETFDQLAKLDKNHFIKLHKYLLPAISISEQSQVHEMLAKLQANLFESS